MRLDDWLTARNIKAVHFARMVGVSESMIARLRAHLREPSLSTARKIARVTSGEVTLDDWPEPESKRKARRKRKEVV